MNKLFRALAVGTTLLAVPMAGCDKRLDIDPVNTVRANKALNTSADVESLLRAGYAIIGSVDLYGGRLQYIADLLGDPDGSDSEVFWGGTYSQPNEIYHKSIVKTNTFVAGTWTQAYQAINIANTVLANLSKVTPSKQNRVEGEAKFIRGAMYFELVRAFAKDWSNGSPTANPGVPLVLSPTDVENPDAVAGAGAKIPRNTVAQVYAQALSDLTAAESKLAGSAPGSPTATEFATTYTASGMLSRVYLQQRRYALAAVEADKVISSAAGFRLIRPISDEFASKINTNEDIFDLQVTVQSGANDLNTFYSVNGRGGDISINDSFISQYDSTDARGQLFDSNLSTKFDEVYGNIHEMRLAEMYLTRAEGNFRAGTSVGATPESDLNTVRARAFRALPSVPLYVPLTSADVNLALILTERHLELAFEGFYLHDLRRNNLPVGNLPNTSPRLVLPIPQREIDVNPSLVQNDGYL